MTLPPRYGSSGPLTSSGGGTLAGDANGPAGNNRVNSLTPVLGPEQALIGSLVPAVGYSRPLMLTPAGQIHAQDPTPVVGAFDYVWRSRAEMVADIAPVGGVFLLPSCSIAISGAIVLQAGERIELNPSTRVLIMGMGEGAQLAIPHNDGQPAGITIPPDSRLVTIGLHAAGSGAVAAADWELIAAAGAFECTNCFFACNAGRVLHSTGHLIGTATRFVTTDAQPAVLLDNPALAPNQLFTNCAITASAGTAVRLTTIAEVQFEGCRINGFTNGIEATLGRLNLSGCYVDAIDANAAAILANGATYVVVEGSRLTCGATGYAVAFPGAAGTLLSMSNCQLFGGGGVYCDATLTQALVSDTYISIGGGTAFNLATPPSRTTLMNVQMIAGTFIVGTTEAAPNCFRGVRLSGTLQTETPITP